MRRFPEAVTLRISGYRARDSPYLQTKSVPLPATNIFLSGWPAHSDLSYVEGHYAPFAVELFTPVLFKRHPSVAYARLIASLQPGSPPTPR